MLPKTTFLTVVSKVAKKFVFCWDLRFAQQVHKGRFAYWCNQPNLTRNELSSGFSVSGPVYPFVGALWAEQSYLFNPFCRVSISILFLPPFVFGWVPIPLRQGREVLGLSQLNVACAVYCSEAKMSRISVLRSTISLSDFSSRMLICLPEDHRQNDRINFRIGILCIRHFLLILPLPNKGSGVGVLFWMKTFERFSTGSLNENQFIRYSLTNFLFVLCNRGPPAQYSFFGEGPADDFLFQIPLLTHTVS